MDTDSTEEFLSSDDDLNNNDDQDIKYVQIKDKPNLTIKDDKLFSICVIS